MASYRQIIFIPIYGQLSVIRKPDSGRMVSKHKHKYNINLFLKTELNNLYHSSQTIALSKGTIFVKNTNFLQGKC